MPPKKREKEVEASKNVRMDHLQADHELFLQAFEKPTQIYRFLRTRNMLKPIFLNRTLSYMKQRMSRSHKSREGFKVDSILEKVLQKTRSETQPYCMGDYMTLTFLGFYDKNLESSADCQVKVEAVLLKLCHKKRKDSSSAVVEVSVGCCSVPLNPSPTEPPAMASAVSISSEAFSPSHGPEVKSYVLMLRVSVSHLTRNNNPIRGASENDNEPAHKRLKTSDNIQRMLGSELVVYDKHNRCLLRSGEYDLVLRDATPPARSPHKGLPTHWETLSEDMDLSSDNNPFDVFKLKPTLKLKLTWSQEPTNGLVTRPKPYSDTLVLQNKTESSTSNKENNKSASNCSRINNILNKNNTDTTIAKTNGHTGSDNKTETSNGQQIIYQFLYNNNSRQQTEACEDLHCPWCSLDCGRLYGLLKHLKLCHSRFTFTYYPIPNGARIDVSINELYDGSYAGSPHRACAGGGGRGGSGPGRRAPLTQMLVCHPRGARGSRAAHRNTNSLAEFREAEDNDMLLDGQRPYITGHNRLYHHTITCLPVYPKELEVDSEGETDPLWLQQKTMMMIDEFTDVNEGEKELMKMWNLHVMKFNFVGDCQIPIACDKFLQTRGKELLEKNLYRNFVLHMCSLHDFGLITPIVVYQTIQKLNQILAESNEAKQKIRNTILQQREHWKTVGIHQQQLAVDPKTLQNANKPSTFNSFNGESSPAVRRKTSSIQTSNRMGSAYNAQHSSTQSTSNETKKKAESSHSAVNVNNSNADNPQRRKSVPVTSASTSSTQVKTTTSTSTPQVPLRRKSAGSSQVIANPNRKRLSLNDRKNST